ncbi:unnamed protein product [Phytophthora fragariaefolia]|uniref:Unnamed protein product n=1 Tax=Phytophthora fragariaefolia TaxID=1490495 RepID=A0A9W6XJI4_9STRA|nr:unnamed protein product [Phytophthora fragariaefolia]
MVQQATAVVQCSLGQGTLWWSGIGNFAFDLDPSAWDEKSRRENGNEGSGSSTLSDSTVAISNSRNPTPPSPLDSVSSGLGGATNLRMCPTPRSHDHTPKRQDDTSGLCRRLRWTKQNNLVIKFLLTQVPMGMLDRVDYKLFVKGHTKNSSDRGFGHIRKFVAPPRLLDTESSGDGGVGFREFQPYRPHFAR